MGKNGRYKCISSLEECNPFNYYLQLKKCLVANGQRSTGSLLVACKGKVWELHKCRFSAASFSARCSRALALPRGSSPA